MKWKIDLYAGVEEDILAMPPKIQARMIKLLELIEEHGAQLGPLILNRWGMDFLK